MNPTLTQEEREYLKSVTKESILADTGNHEVFGLDNYTKNWLDKLDLVFVGAIADIMPIALFAKTDDSTGKVIMMVFSRYWKHWFKWESWLDDITPLEVQIVKLMTDIGIVINYKAFGHLDGKFKENEITGISIIALDTPEKMDAFFEEMETNAKRRAEISKFHKENR